MKAKNNKDMWFRDICRYSVSLDISEIAIILQCCQENFQPIDYWTTIHVTIKNTTLVHL